MRLYLDYNATAPILPEAREALAAALDAANPSSVHGEGRAARALVERARVSVARLLGAESENVVFTSGATEAAANSLTPRWLVAGVERRVSRLAVLDTDHPCLREAGGFPAEDVTRLPVDGSGAFLPGALAEWVDGLGPGETGLLALTLANSETGVVQPLDRIRAVVADKPVLLVLDVVQAVGRMPVSLAETGADALILSGHKLGAAKGVGALVLAEAATRPFALIRGGGQEGGRRSGTEPVPAIASFGAAAEVAFARGKDPAREMAARRETLERMLLTRVPGAVILGEAAQRIPNTVAVAVPGLRAETAQIALDLAGFAVSAGSACSSGKVGRSHVVEAMAKGGLALSPQDGAIRVSFGPDTALDDLLRFADAFASLAARTIRAPGRGRAA
ncbi:cysteine desulfurase family protein [Jiella sp. M17.18]|uniref:cysteine desulfurase family protein n=1 Tax=Jiella sp. M17.18 TaxID=3234247 RepID=UPI0034DE6EDA